MRNLTFLLIVIIFSACSKRINSLFKDDRVKQSTSPYVSKEVYKAAPYQITNTTGTQEIKLTYLGAGGFYIRNQHAGILIDPFFSNTRFLSVPSFGVKTKKQNVEFALASFKDLEEKVKAVFISHGHYDHLMDAPYVVEKYLSFKPSIYTSTSGVNMINQIPGITAINLQLKPITSQYKLGRYYDFTSGSGKITIWPIATSHAPHLANIRLYDGESKKHALKKSIQRRRAGRWKLGQAFSYLVDFKDTMGKITYRIYIQSSAAPPKYGYLHPDLKDDHRVDLAILGAASFGNTNDYPEALVDHLQPDRVLICHWEDFFVRYKRKNKRLVRFTNVRTFINRLNAVFPYQITKEERFTMPKPGVDIIVKY